MKKAYLVLDELVVKSPIFPITYPEGMIRLCAIFKTKKQAKKWGDNIVEVTLTKTNLNN